MRRLFSALAILTAVCVAAGCGQQTSVTPIPATSASPGPFPIYSSAPTASPVPLPTQSPFTSQSLLIPLPSPSAGSYVYPLPAGGGYIGQLAVPVAGTLVGSSVTLTVQSSSALPSGAPVLQSLARTPEALRGTLASAPISPFYYLTLVWSGTVQIGSGLIFTVTPPSGIIVSGASYYEAFYDPTNAQAGWQLGFAGPATSADAKTLTFVTPSSFQYIGLQPYVAALYAISAAAPSPSPAPAPTLTPTAGLSFNPASLTLAGVGTTYAQTVTLNESGYAGLFNVTSTCATTPVATISPTSGSGPSLTLTVTGQNAGTCVATGTDSFGQTATLNISVTTGGIKIQQH